MIPVHVARRDFSTKAPDPEPLDLVGLDQRDDRRRAPCADNIEVSAEIAVPAAGQRVLLLLARAEGDADAPGRMHAFHLGDLQRVGPAGARHPVSPLSRRSRAS